MSRENVRVDSGRSNAVVQTISPAEESNKSIVTRGAIMTGHNTDGAALMTRRTWLATGSAMCLTACTTGRAPELRGSSSTLRPSPSTLDLDDLPRWMRLASVPGVAVAVIDRERVSARGFGITRAGGADAVNADTVFEAASLSKPVFAYLVLRLAADGALDLDRPLGEYLPLPNPSDAAARPITARNVLSHTTGW
ncbi:MAG: beta-lactamase family protein, partial [Gemmatimonadota bacterium]|nr:beta-lactamase family protein [Gemmatimonadota bacterium]